VVVHPFAVIGGDPQYLKFDRSTASGVRVGAGTVIREHVTINRSVNAGNYTSVGANCFFMAASHVAHDCEVSDNVVLANAALLAGHVTVGGHSFLGGGAAVHQFCRIGESVMVAGHASITRDVPHFTMVAERDEVIGFNAIGLKRRGFNRVAIAELKAAFKDVYFTPGNIREVAAQRLAANAFETPEARRFLEFFAGGKRSFARVRRAAAEEEQSG
jgi:UDP-N-acetylglucosamine acyltransferase